MNAPNSCKPTQTTEWTARIVASVILLQTLFFKFAGSLESVYLFSQLGMESWGRMLIGYLELITVILLLIPGRRWAGTGALMGVVLMTGAIFAHLTTLGIAVQGDGGTLFALAVITLVACLCVLACHFLHVPILGTRIARLIEAEEPFKAST